LLEQVTELIEAERLRGSIQHPYPLAEAAEAHRTIKAKRTAGKILLVP
jgi:NADPH:quinone reductase-like Zn-dependent oxidoreductase